MGGIAVMRHFLSPTAMLCLNVYIFCVYDIIISYDVCNQTKIANQPITNIYSFINKFIKVSCCIVFYFYVAQIVL